MKIKCVKTRVQIYSRLCSRYRARIEASLTEYKVKPIESEHDLDENLQLMRTVFGQNDGVDIMTKRILDNQPDFTWKNFLTVRHEGKMVASLNIIPQTWSIGGIPVKAAEMGMVATLPEYRNRGLQRILNSEYDKMVNAQGFDLSVIEGIPYFYRQFNYEYTIPLDVEAEIQLSKIPYNHKGAIREFEVNDIPCAIKMLDDSQRKFLVHSIRTRSIWEIQQRTGWQADWPFKGYVLVENGESVAYFRISIRGDTIYLIEITDVNQAQAKSILSFIKSVGEEAGAKNLVTRVSHEEPFIKYMLSVGGIKHKPYAWQIKVVNHKQLFEKLAPLFSKRIATSSYGELTERIKLNLYKQCLLLDINNGTVNEINTCQGERKDDIRMNPTAFPKLLFGVMSRQEMQDFYHDFSVTAKYHDIIDVLFPKGTSYIHPCY